GRAAVVVRRSPPQPCGHGRDRARPGVRGPGPHTL
ncbi:MAG: hypothetical protein AVDCRST_MAG50-576, partial [uncultured Acidimicrobiales bacterium]